MVLRVSFNVEKLQVLLCFKGVKLFLFCKWAASHPPLLRILNMPLYSAIAVCFTRTATSHIHFFICALHFRGGQIFFISRLESLNIRNDVTTPLHI